MNIKKPFPYSLYKYRGKKVCINAYTFKYNQRPYRRCNKIIKFFELLGGINRSGLNGGSSTAYYYIGDYNEIRCTMDYPKGYTEIKI